jgi:hypothetical protein
MVKKRMQLELYVSVGELLVLKEAVDHFISYLEDEIDSDEREANAELVEKVDQLLAARATKGKLDVSFH